VGKGLPLIKKKEKGLLCDVSGWGEKKGTTSLQEGIEGERIGIRSIGQKEKKKKNKQSRSLSSFRD